MSRFTHRIYTSHHAKRITFRESQLEHGTIVWNPDKGDIGPYDLEIKVGSGDDRGALQTGTGKQY